jgi:aminopeptidase N
MATAGNTTIYLKDYTPPPYLVDCVDLHFDLDEEATRVRSRLSVRRNPAGAGSGDLVLWGQELELLGVLLDGQMLGAGEYRVDEESLTVPGVPEAFVLEVETLIHPSANTALEGLYVSGGNFCTQCEAEGFRRITYFPDRPDVMAVFTTTLAADPDRYPVLLSNGNPVGQGTLQDGRHFATWHDPFPKPCYLFALVAGDLVCVEGGFTTRSGREIPLQIYVREYDREKCGHAMQSLKKAMAWDEQKYGREYDLDRYMIVAVNDFNMGAMENKGLNLFNSRYVLASPDTATDSDYAHIEGVIAHEYFHNWSGNRITCRDWFQLSLKEGFTVFRDQQFSADMNSAGVKRIEDVRLLRTHQFQEDAGPMAHPVRPDAYQEINNFYTTTVYNKGAEVVRMLHTLLGPEGFRRGTDRYFQHFDGQAVTTDDFVAALEEANDRDFSQFRRWYSQAGTPVLKVGRRYDPQAQTYTLTVAQSCPSTPGQPEKAPFHIPLKMALLDREGKELALHSGDEPAGDNERVLELTEAEHTFTFTEIPSEPVPSLLRAFSAPVRLEVDLDDGELAFLMAYDADEFNRWEAGQQLAVRVMLRLIQVLHEKGRPELDSGLSQAFGATLEATDLDPAFVAEALTLPGETYLGDFMPAVDPDAIHVVRQFLRRELAAAHRGKLTALYEGLADASAYRVDAEAMGRRRLRNLCLAYLTELGDEEVRGRAEHQFYEAANMTDAMAALSVLVHTGAPEQHPALAAFYNRWREDPLVLDKWFAIQATSPIPGTLEAVRRLTEHPDFTLRNPNRVRAVVGAFCSGNPVRFHDRSGDGYAFLGEHVLELDRLNPQVAARLLTPLTRWRRYDETRQGLMRAELERILETASLSKDVREIASKSLA